MQVLLAMFLQHLYDDCVMVFPNRLFAGKKLASLLAKELHGKDIVVYALPRGGIVIALPIVKRLSAPLDLVITRKISPPNQPEYAIGAVGLHGSIIGDEKAMRAIDQDVLLKKIKEAREEIQRRKTVYSHEKRESFVAQKIAVIVDDGIATGHTMFAAIKEIAKMQPKRIIVTSPVIAYETYKKLKEEVDDVIALVTPHNLQAIGQHYHEFPQISDEEVIRLLEKTRFKIM